MQIIEYIVEKRNIGKVTLCLTKKLLIGILWVMKKPGNKVAVLKISALSALSARISVLEEQNKGLITRLDELISLFEGKSIRVDREAYEYAIRAHIAGDRGPIEEYFRNGGKLPGSRSVKGAQKTLLSNTVGKSTGVDSDKAPEDGLNG